jgi:hypothetical protein
MTPYPFLPKYQRFGRTFASVFGQSWRRFSRNVCIYSLFKLFYVFHPSLHISLFSSLQASILRYHFFIHRPQKWVPWNFHANISFPFPMEGLYPHTPVYPFNHSLQTNSGSDKIPYLPALWVGEHRTGEEKQNYRQLEEGHSIIRTTHTRATAFRVSAQVEQSNIYCKNVVSVGSRCQYRQTLLERHSLFIKIHSNISRVAINRNRIYEFLVPKFVGSNPAEAVGFFGKKNPQHAFLRRGNKAVCPMSCFTACKRTQKWRGSCHFRQNFSAISRPYFHLPLLGSLASLQTLGASCGESWNALNPWFSSKLGVRRAAGNGTL